MTISTQTIAVSLGAVEYTWPVTITETNGKNITGDTVQISLGTYDAPGTWQAGVVQRPGNSTAVIQLLINNTVAAGSYWVWVKVTDSPEIVPRRCQRITVT